MKITRKIINIDEDLCDGCGQCVPSCAEGAIQIIDNKARIVADKYCDGLGACLGECPKDALTIEEREAEEFDEEAVEEYLESIKQDEGSKEETMACGCPSTQIESFVPSQPCAQANEPVTQENTASQLSHWPVQIRLVPPTAPFLKGADLLVAADCTPVAYPDFHGHFLKGKVVMLGCPKFDNAQEYIDKFAAIFKANKINSITVVAMDVPCCQGLPIIIERALSTSGSNIPVEKIIISSKGEVVSTEKLAA
ncbi:ATP-binding protein [Thermodesulfobacteriota bacterium]